MVSMKWQFTTHAIFKLVAFVAIALAGMATSTRFLWGGGEDRGFVIRWVADYSTKVAPYWIPLIFAAYVLGRRKISVPLLIAFAMAECVAFTLAVKWH